MKKSSKLLVLFSFLLVLISSCSSEKLYSQLHQKLLEQSQEEAKQDFIKAEFEVAVSLKYGMEKEEEKSSGSLSIAKKPLYVSMETEGVVSSAIYEENNKFYLYSLEEEKEGVLYYDRSPVESKEDINLSDIYKELYIGQSLIPFKEEHVKVSRIIFGYSLSLSYENASKYSFLSSYIQVLKKVGMSNDAINKASFVLDYVFLKKGYRMTLTIKMSEKIRNTKAIFKIIEKIEVNYKKFDLDKIKETEKIFIYSSNSIENINEEQFGTRMLIKKNQTAYAKMFLEEGQYYVSTSNSKENSKILFEVRDMQGNLIPSGVGITISWKTYLEEDCDFQVKIPKSDYYYVKVQNYATVRTIVTFNKLDYLSVMPEYNLEDNSINKIEFEGEHDYVIYKYYSEKEGFAFISQQESSSFRVIHSSHPFNYIEETVSGTTANIRINKGTNVIVLGADGTGDNYTKEARFLFQFVEDVNGLSKDINDMETITEEWSSEYMGGYGSPDKYAKIVVERRSLCVFETQSQHTHPIITIDTMETEHFLNANRFILSPGTHVVMMSCNDHLFSKYRVRVEKTEIEDIDKEIQLQEFEATYYIAPIPTIENELKYKYQKAIYRFVLDKTQTVAYKEKQVVLYNKEGKKISFDISADRDGVYTYAILDKGEYYFEVKCSSDLEVGDPIYLGIVSNDLKLDAPLTNLEMTKLSEGETITLNKNYALDREYVEINVTKGGYYTFSNRFSIYDKDRKIVINQTSSSKWFLNEGEYILVYDYLNKSNESVVVSFNLV